jgi:predicted PurR-regulated permease PerM
VTVEREVPVLGERPVPVGWLTPLISSGTIAHMAETPPPVVGGRSPTGPIEVPRWIQLVGLPLVLLLAWAVAGAVRHAVFLFLVAALVSLLLNPLVRALGRVRIPRGFGVAIVYMTFAAALVIGVVALATVVVDQSRSASERIDAYLTNEDGRTGETAAEVDLDRLQMWLDDHRLGRIRVEEQGREFIADLDVESFTRTVIDWAEGAALGIFAFLFGAVLVLVVSIYMLLDFNRLQRALDRRFPPPPGSPSLLPSIEASVGGYVKGQLLVSAIIGASAGVSLWLLGTVGWLPEGFETYAILFGAWVAVAELIPYLGPWLGAIPPVLYGLIVDPLSAVWVVLLFLAIHQIEGHIVIPKVMGSALRLHPLLVIFGLVAGGEIYGLPGVFVALPTLAAGRAIWDFFGRRIALESWEGSGTVPVEVELEPPAAVRR